MPIRARPLPSVHPHRERLLNRRIVVISLAAVLLAAGCSVSRRDANGTDAGTGAGAGDLVAIHLAADGLDPFLFGETPALLIDEMTVRFGGPDGDTGWVVPSGIYATCPGREIQALSWGTLVGLFTRDDDTQPGAFFAWTYGFDPDTNLGGDPRQLGLVTIDGIGLGSTRRELRDAYGARLDEIEDTAAETWRFTIDGGERFSLRGLLDGPGDDAVISSIESAQGCG